MPRPEDLIAVLRERGATIATAESLTGGAVCAALVSVPGASAAVRGGVIAYTADAKSRLLGVPPRLIAREGVVSAAVAEAMAAGVRDATGATYGVATTGVAGPDPLDGLPPGQGWCAVAGPDGLESAAFDIVGDRAAVRAGAVDAALAAALAALGQNVTPL